MTYPTIFARYPHHHPYMPKTVPHLATVVALADFASQLHYLFFERYRQLFSNRMKCVRHMKWFRHMLIYFCLS